MVRKNGLLSNYLSTKRNLLVLKHIKGNNVIDIGCNVGKLNEILPPEIVYTGLDIYPKEILKPKFNYLELDIEKKIEFSQKTNCVTMIAVIEHLKNPQNAIKNVYKMLNPNGVLIITTPTTTGDRIHKILSKIGMVSSKAAEDHQKIFSLEELNELLEENGFSVIESRKFLSGFNQIVVGKKKE